MPDKKKPDPEEAIESDEARLPRKGALMPEHPRDGTAESSDVHELARRAVESGEDPEVPLDFDPPAGNKK